MSAFAPLVANDQAPVSPLNVTLNPLGMDNKGVATYRSSTNNGYLSATTLSTSRRTLQDGQIKDRLVLIRPIMESITGTTNQGYVATPKVAYQMKVDLEVTTHVRSDFETRQRFWGVLRSLLGDSAILGQVLEGNLPY